jgi:N-acetylglucosamine-6-phosphate deacetylase
MLLPGFVDLQVNGYRGIDFSGPDLTEESCIHACRELLDHGTIAFLPTIITNCRENYRRNLPILGSVVGQAEFSNKLLGIHVEGPFISDQPGAIGAHNPDWAQNPDIGYLKEMQQWANGHIKLVTIAANLPGAEEFTTYAVKKGIIVSLGHQLPTSQDLCRLAKAGARILTHLGNGMPAQTHRHENQIFLGIAEDSLFAMLIPDGHHLPSYVIKSIIRGKGVDRIVVTSDASAVAGLEPGRYKTLGHAVIILDNTGRVYDPESDLLAGSSATMLECMNHLASLDLLTTQELISVSYKNPLRLLSIDPDSLGHKEKICFENNQFHVE